MAAKDDLGRFGEDRASTYLTARGYRVLDRNWRCALGELDIVALDDRAGEASTIVVVEVKTRSSEVFGHPLEAVDARKRARLWRLAHAWAATHPDHARGRELRIDVVAIIGADPCRGSLEHLVDVR